jgi:hypothetical protein
MIPRSPLLAILLGGPVAFAACSVGFATPEPNPTMTVKNSGDSGAGEDAEIPPPKSDAPQDGAPEAGGPAQAVHGSPLCNAQTNTCFPDVPATPQECRLAPDAGLFDASSGYMSPFLACRVLPATSSALSSAVQPYCVSGGSAADGSWCKSSVECAPTYDCVGAGPSGTCQRYCCAGNLECDPGDFCDIATTIASAIKIPVCMPIHPSSGCDLLDGTSCPPNQTCAVVRENSGSTSCVAIGQAQTNEECDTDHCAAGLVCLGTPGQRKCYELCNIGGSDGGSGCQGSLACKGGLPLFPDPSVGICQ